MADEERGRLRRRDADRVDDHGLLRAASIAVVYAWRRNSRSARVPSTPKYATVMSFCAANVTALRMRFSISSRSIP